VNRVIPDRDLVYISKKKPSYPVTPMFREYLDQYDRTKGLPLDYSELIEAGERIPVYDSKGNETHWYTMIYPRSYREEIDEKLKKIYAQLSIAGDTQAISHLYIDRIDFCEFGNSQPFRIRVVNRYNDNHDYYYVKTADASRLYGLELEHILSPNRINVLVYGDTLIEEHIPGIPGDVFIRDYLPKSVPKPLSQHETQLQNQTQNQGQLQSQSETATPTTNVAGFQPANPIRVAKEFVKFNERCFAKLLGDMRSYNYVAVVTQDFDERQYRVRAIDFDRQSHEPELKYYMPQFYKENQPVVSMVWEHLSPDTIKQYQKEERSLMARRAEGGEGRLSDLFSVMVSDEIAPPENTKRLAQDIARFHKREKLANLTNMGEVTREHFLYTIDEQ
jgi:hypothetical protein